MSTVVPNRFEELIARLDAAVPENSENACCFKVKTVLEEVIASGDDFLDPSFLRTAPDRYARRLVHRDPAGRYSVLAMVWGEGQGTAIHDHAGMWCCEVVYRGRIRVQSYSLEGSADDEVVRFHPEEEIMAGVGEAGALIPPFDYHTIHNVDPTPAVTLHVYGGEMTWCHAFVPTEGGYRRERRELCYTED